MPSESRNPRGYDTTNVKLKNFMLIKNRTMDHSFLFSRFLPLPLSRSPPILRSLKTSGTQQSTENSQHKILFHFSWLYYREKGFLTDMDTMLISS
jgi:hypothetical protein